MSWSISIEAKSSEVIKRLNDYSVELGDGQSKMEYDQALPSLIKLIELNYTKDLELTVNLQAWGHGVTDNGELISNSVTVRIN